MNILVTGGAGFIGSHLVERLFRDGEAERIVVLDNFNDYYNPAVKRANIEEVRREYQGLDLEVAEIDLRDASAVSGLFERENFCKVYHLAAMAGVRASIEQPLHYFDVNVRGTIHLLQAAVACGKPPFIFASSSSVYGGSPRIPFTEEDPVNEPVSPYAASKKAAELACHTFHHLYGLDITCLRFFTVYGPRQRPEMAIHLFTRRILHGDAVPMFGDGTTSRDYTYVDDIIDGVAAAGRKVSGFRIYNLGNSQPVALHDLIARLSKALGVEPRIEQLPRPPGDVERTWADLARVSADLGYQPKTGLDEGLHRFVEWYRASHS